MSSPTSPDSKVPPTDSFADPLADTLSSAAPSQVRMEPPVTRGVSQLGPGELFAGRYRIEGLLGKGGFGIVYRALDEGPLQRWVALKILQQNPVIEPERAALVCQQFILEARLAASLSHPNIVTVFEVGTYEGHLYFTQELIAGRDLHAHQKDVGHFTVEQVLSIISDIGAALSHAHGMGILHQDIKPSNILRGYNGKIKLTDFGLARAMGVDGTLGSTSGTPGYMSPEQIREEAIDARSDQFALGCVAYELLSGHRPFEAPSLSEVFRKTLRDTPPPLSSLRGDVPGAVVAAIERAMQKDPAARFDTVQDFVTGLVYSGSLLGIDPLGTSGMERLLPTYLEATREAHRFVPIVGGQNRIKLDLALEQIYVPLRARLHRVLGEEDPSWSFHHQSAKSVTPMRRRPGRRKGLESELQDDCFFEADIAVEQAFATAIEYELRGCIILGDPGSGKTTLLKRLLVQCVDLGSVPLGLPPDVVPIMLPLRYLRDLTKGLDSFIQDQLEVNPNLPLSPGFGRRLLERGRLLFLLDGLDEVASATDRIRVRGWIEQAMKDRPDCYFAVTSRYTGYHGEARFASSRFLELHVKPFDDEQAKRFVLQWHLTVERHLKGRTRQSQVSAEADSVGLWTRLDQLTHGANYAAGRRLREMMGNPLLLTILCFVHQMEGDLPRDRALLYEACIKVLLEHWPLMRTRRFAGQETHALPWEGRLARRLLQPVAWWLHQQEERTRASANDLVPLLEVGLYRLRQEPGDARRFLEAIRDQSGLLVGWDVDSFGFMHLSFQEYLAALHVRHELLNHNHAPLQELVLRFGESWWRETTLLLMALEDPPLLEPFMNLLVDSPAFSRHTELVLQCIDEASEGSATPFLRVLGPDSRSTSATQFTALQALKALKNLHDPRIVEACQRLKHSSHARVQALALELLAARGIRASSLKAGDVWVHWATGLEFVYVPAGSFQMGGNERDEEQPLHKVTFARGFWMGKYPVTNNQYGRFLAANPTHREPEYWKDSQFNGAEQPVVGVSWSDALAYCRWADGLLLTEGEPPPEDAAVMVLPSEAEWEYAARGLQNWEYPWGNQPPTAELANFDRKAGRTTPVWQYPKGASWVGAQDLSGNVWEWCADPWHENYMGAPNDGGVWGTGGHDELRVVRGGGWFSDAYWLRSAYRGGVRNKGLYRGFRVAAVPRRAP